MQPERVHISLVSDKSASVQMV